MTNPNKIEPFQIAVAQADIDDLKCRLSRTRWPDQAKGAPWAYGADLGFMKVLADHWLNSYDWRRWERRLNAFPNFQVEIEGKRLHFLMERGSGENPLPLLLSHGWPGSVAEFLEVIDPLAHPEKYGGDAEDGFTVVVPSLPGFGFSEAYEAPITPADIARIFSTLMVDVLGFDRYVAQGGDWGAIITSWIALDHPRGLLAIHLNGPGLGGGHKRPEPEDDPLTEEEIEWQENDAVRRQGIMAYQQIQGTEPQTMAYGLTDSPIGLAAWIIQRFHTWTVRGSEAPPPFELDHLLTDIMLYWLSGINAPNWLYISLLDGTARNVEEGRKITIPTGFTLCPDDNTVPAPDHWLERVFGNIVRRKDAKRGGHFFAFEQGDVFIVELRTFFREFQAPGAPKMLRICTDIY